MKSTILVLVLTVAALLTVTAPAFAQGSEGTPADRAYFQAYYMEKALRDFEAAETAYGRVIELAGPTRELAVHIQAVLGRGRCLLALGRNEEAVGAFKWVLGVDPKNAEALAALAKEQDTAGKEQDLLNRRIHSLVLKLGGAERAQAQKDLLLVGNRAVPQLQEALRSRQVGEVEGAAKTLALIGTSDSMAALASGFRDEAVVFPKALSASLSYIQRAGGGGLEVYLAAMENADSNHRCRIIQTLGGKLNFANYRNECSPKTMARILDLGLQDPAPEAKIAVLTVFRSSPGTFNAGGHDPLSDEAWIELIESREPNVSWNALSSLSRLRGSNAREWSPELCGAIVGILREIAEGRRPTTAASYCYNTLHYPAYRHFGTDDLLDLFAAVAGSGKFDQNTRRGILERIASFLTEAREKDPTALAELAREGWSKILVPVGREFWINYFTKPELLSEEIELEAAGIDSPRVRQMAYHNIQTYWSKYKPEAVAAALNHLEEDLLGPDRYLRMGLLSVLHYFPVPAAVAPLRQLRTMETDSDTRAQALIALVKAIGKEALPDVRADLALKKWETARGLLIKLLGVDAVPELVALAKRLKDGARPVTTSEGYLGVPGEVAAAYVDQLPEGLRNGRLAEKTAPVLSPGKRAELVIHALKSKNLHTILGGARAAESLHIEEAWPYLVPLLDHTNSAVRTQAKEALTSIRSYRELKASFTESGPGGSAQVIEDAIALTKSEDPLKRRGGALALGALGSRAGIPVLLGLLDDADEQVKAAALAALERLGGKAEKTGEK